MDYILGVFLMKPYHDEYMYISKLIPDLDPFFIIIKQIKVLLQNKSFMKIILYSLILGLNYETLFAIFSNHFFNDFPVFFFSVVRVFLSV